MNLTIITPCTRPENLPAIYASLNFPFKEWWIVFDMDWSEGTHKIMEQFKSDLRVNAFWLKKPTWGNAQRNAPLEYIKEGFLYFLDDDNLIHPEMYSVISEQHKRYQKKIYVFEQIKEDGSIRHLDIRQGGVDLAQFIVHRNMMNDMKFVNLHDADGIYLSHMFATCPEEFNFICQPLAYYNKLKGAENVDK